MREIGFIKQVQIQRSSLKLGEKPYRVYSPSPLMVVNAIQIDPTGVVGMTLNGEEIVDVHNIRHPETRNGGVNGVSVGFTGHYRAMRAEFGDHLVDGCAGENILVEISQILKLEDLGSRLAFQNQQTGQLAYFDDLMVAAPCVEFSHYTRKANLKTSPLPAEIVKATLQFLDRGLRGFYAAAREPITVQTGDRVFAVDNEARDCPK